MRDEASALAVLLRDHPRWALLIHEKPDGDALGCGAALALRGLGLGREVLFCGPDPAPRRYRFIAEGAGYRALPVLPEEWRTADAAVLVLDSPTPARTVRGLPAPDSPHLALLDHHPGGEPFAPLRWVEPSASSCAELLLDLFGAAGWSPDAAEATALYVALVSDCGGFRFSSTSPRTHRAAARLLEAGARPAEVDRLLNDTLSPEALRLWGTALARAEILAEGRLALAWLGKDDFLRTGALPSDTEDLVNWLLRVEGVMVACLCTEQEGTLRGSLRTREPYSARAFAASCGGGGHDRAAGFRMPAPLERALPDLRRSLEDFACPL